MGTGVFGGVEKYLYNIYKHINKNIIQFDFLAIADNEGFNLVINELTSLGAKFYKLGVSKKNVARYIHIFISTRIFLKKHHYDVVHINSGSLAYQILISLAAKTLKIKKIISHSHNCIANSKKKEFIWKVIKSLLPLLATDCVACSYDAAKSLFPLKLVVSNRVKIFNNAIDAKKYVFNQEERVLARREFRVCDDFLIGHIGRLSIQKNHSFLLDIFNEVNKIYTNSKLILIGKGELEDKIREKVDLLGLNNKVIFTGERDDIPELLSAMDVFVFPSLYEGLPIAPIEAQANGLVVLAASTITKEVKITDCLEFISLKDTPFEWATRVLCFANGYVRKNTYSNIYDAGYDIGYIIKDLENLYCNISC